MTPALHAELIRRYPKFFREPGKRLVEPDPEDPSSSENHLEDDMGPYDEWGIECGDGWFDLIDALCECLQFWTDHNNGEPQVVVRQVKQKFGTLRFYCKGVNERQRGMIDMAVTMSNRICEECGAPGEMVGYRICCPVHGPKEVDSGQELCR